MTGVNSMSDVIKESVIKILEILSTADPVRDAMTVEGENIPCQYVIDSHEANQCKKLLNKINDIDKAKGLTIENNAILNELTYKLNGNNEIHTVKFDPPLLGDVILYSDNEKNYYRLTCGAVTALETTGVGFSIIEANQ